MAEVQTMRKTYVCLLRVPIVDAYQILFAVDHPFEKNGLAIAGIDAAPIFDEGRDKLDGANAERLFKL